MTEPSDFASLILLLKSGSDASETAAFAREALALDRVGEAFAVGVPSPGDRAVLEAAGVRLVDAGAEREGGTTLRRTLERCRGRWTILQDAVAGYSAADYPALLQPLVNGESDAVYGVRYQRREDGRIHTRQGLADKVVGVCACMVTDLAMSDISSGMRAFRTQMLKDIPLAETGDGMDVELAVKLSAQLFRIHEIPLHVDSRVPGESVASSLRRMKTLARYVFFANDGDNMHEGYNTLLRMEEGAPRYNAWLGRKLSRHLGRRVLEVGAGIGTITKEIARGRELVIALEVDRFYYDRLVNLFAGLPQVRPVLSGVEQADWDRLAGENLDSIVLSNVLEHIEDDRAALRNFRRVLKPGGKVVCLAPAIPGLFGSMDQAVGHYRRYTRQGLAGLFGECGFKVDVMEPMNVLGIPGWFVNGRILKRRGVPPLQLRAYDLVSPLVAMAEERMAPRVGMSLLAVGEAV